MIPKGVERGKEGGLVTVGDVGGLQEMYRWPEERECPIESTFGRRDVGGDGGWMDWLG